MTIHDDRNAGMAAGSEAGLPTWREAVAALEKRASDDHACGLHDHAVAALREARDIAQAYDDAREIWRGLTRQIANICERIGDLGEAGRHYDASRPPADATPDERYAWANGRALLAERRVEWELATALYRDVVRLFSHLQAPGANSLFGLSNAAAWAAGCGDAALAAGILERFRQALAERTDAAVTYELPMIEAEIARAAGDLETAERCWAQVADIARRTGQEELLPSVAEERSSILLALGRRDEALSLLRAHLPDDDAETYAMSHMAAAVALGACLADPATGDRDPATLLEARKILRPALCTEAARGMPDAEWRILASFAELAAGSGRQEAAIVFGKAAVSIIAAMHHAVPPRPAYAQRELDQRLHPHRQLLSRLVEAGRFPEAARIQAAMKEETVFDLARRDDNLDVRTKSVPLRPAEEALLNAYRNHCLEARQAHSSLRRDALSEVAPAQAERDLHAKRLAVAAWADDVLDNMEGTPVSPVRAREAARIAMPDGIAHLHFLRSDDRWCVYLRSAHTERSYEAGHARDIAHEIFRLRSAILRPTTEWQPIAATLFDRLLRPVNDVLHGLSLLRITADMPIGYTPFAALHDGAQFLIERVALATGTGIAGTQRRPPPVDDWRVLLFGNAGAGARTIAHVEDELHSIARAYPAARRIAPFTAGRLADALAPGAEVVHLASHFHLEPARPDRSYLALDANERLTLGMLRSGDFNLSQTELLVLSACDTAVADIGDYGLESLAGLARAKGARHVLGSLWPVADASAARLMALFYAEAFKAGEGAPPSWPACLRRAQLALMRETTPPAASPHRAGGLSLSTVADWSHPYHWAGYVVYD